MGAISRRILSVFGKLGIVAIVAVAFTFGLVATVYLSLRSPKIQVPDVLNKPYMEGETTLEKAGLSMRERARRYKPDIPPGVILDQSPRAGEVVKAGQTIAVVVSRARKEGEQPPSEEVAEERKREETGEAKNQNSNESKNENRERRNKNKNTNANANANSNLNGNRNAGARNSSTGNRNLSNTNTRNANQSLNANRGANANNSATRPRITNNRNINSSGGRNTNSSRPLSNTNRRQNP